MTFAKHKRTALLSLIAILFLTLFLHLGALTSDIQRGIPDWHPDSARYLIQGIEYIKHNYKPIGTTPWYTGNPYANILILSYIWRGLDHISVWAGFGHIPLTKLNFSLVSRLFYLFLCLFLTFMIYAFASHVFQSHAIGLLSALIWAISPLSIDLNHIIKPEIPLTFFITLAAITAYKLSERNNFLFYVLGGITAGIATAVKYNGAIVLVYLYLMHAYRIYKQGQRKKISFSLVLKSFLSIRLIAAGILWALIFYALEPILWLNFSKGIVYIHQYIHTSAYAATPPDLKIHTGLIPFLLYSIKTMPHNLWIFARSAHPLILLFAIAGIFLSNGSLRSKQYGIALFPLIILFILFATKPLIGTEFLLHFMPFVFILTALGLYFTYKRISVCRIIGAKAIASLPIFFTIAICLYGSLYEIKYFSVGNIRYHAQNWIQENLNGQCLHLDPLTLRHYPDFCKNKQPVASVIYSKTSLTKQSNGIILKTFNLEKSRPLMHLIRRYKICVVGSRKFFDAKPYVPKSSLPCPSSTETSYIRFLNGVNLNPAYNAFFLHPNTTYVWTFVTKHSHATLKCYIINGDGISSLQSPNLSKTIKLLPYEHKTITIIPFLSFPWRKPYLYTFSLRSSRRLYLRLFPRKAWSLPSFYFQKSHLLPPDFSTQKAISLLSSFPPRSSEAFRKTFRAIFHYDFSLLQKFLSEQITPKTFRLSTQPRPFFQPAGPEDSYLWTPIPVFCNTGQYHLKGYSNIFLPPHSSIIFLVTTLGRILAKRTISSNKTIKKCILGYSLDLPFQVPSGAPVYFVIIQKNAGKISLKSLSLQVPFYSTLKTALEGKILWAFLEGKPQRLSLSRYVSTFNPSDFPPSVCLKVGSAFLGLNQITHAIQWLQSTTTRDPLNRKAWFLLGNTYRCLSKPQKAQKAGEILKSLSKIETGDWTFQTGLSLRGYTLPTHSKRNGVIPITLYLFLPNYNGDLSAFISFMKDGNFYFGKDFSLLDTIPFGNYARIDSSVRVPAKIPPGIYQVHFTFRMPKMDLRYRYLKGGKTLKKENILLKQIKIN